MKKVNVALVRLLQFVVFVLFTFMVIAYFAAMVLLPLDAIALLIKLMENGKWKMENGISFLFKLS